MKRLLLASSALVVCCAVTAHADEPLSLTLGGFFKAQLGFAENQQRASGSGTYSASNSAASKYNKFEVQDYAALNFVGKTKLDNGITVGVEMDTIMSQYNDSRGSCGVTNYQPQGGTANGKINVRSNSGCNPTVKRSFGTFSSAYGSLIAGEREDITNIVHVAAPDVSWGLQDSDWWDFVNAPVNHIVIAQTNTSRWTTRAPKITYVTPSFYGVSAGVSYTPNVNLSIGNNLSANSSSDNANWANIGYDGRISGNISRTDLVGDAWSGAIAFNNTFGPVGIKADVGLTQMNYLSERLVNAGVQISAYGFTLGGSYLYRGLPDHTSALSTTDPSTAVSCNPLCYIGPAVARAGAFAGHSEDIALAYSVGPYSVSFGYFGDRTASSTHASDTTSMYALSAAYAFGPGMSAKAQAFHYEFGAGDKNPVNQNKGNGLVTGVQVNF